MALKVWLPLNKDTRNVGLNNVNVTNNGATLTTGGVYTNCYHFGTSSSYMTLPPSCMTGFTTACTVAFWLRIKTWNTSYATFFQAGKGSSPWAHYVFGFLRNAGNSTICFTISNSSSSSQNAYLTSALSLNTWYHVVLVYETGKCKIYLNGALDHQYTTTFVPYFAGITKITLGTCNATSSYQTDCDMNDFRIYDNALNDEDIKRIYQKKIFDLVPYSGIKNVLFDRSGFCMKHLIDSSEKYYSNSVYFNGTNQIIKSREDGFEISGGTLSVWFLPKTKPSGNGTIFYLDGNSRMACGLYNSATQFIVATKTNSPTYPASSVVYGSWNHIIITYGENYVATNCYLNGVKLTQSSTNNWSNDKSILEIGGRTLYSSFFDGRVSCIKVYKTQLTQYDCLKLYNEERNMFLPDEYEELEYIQSTGTQYIDTGLKTKGEYLRITTKFLISSYNQSIRPFGSQKNTQCTIVPWPKNSDNPYGWLAIGTDYFVQTTSSSYFLTNINEDLFMDVIASNGTVKGHYCGYKLNSTYPGSIQNGYNNYIFASNRNGSPQIGGTQRLYFFKMYLEENVLAFNGIPAKRKSDNVIGMYDMVSRQFFTNSGTGSFTGA